MNHELNPEIVYKKFIEFPMLDVQFPTTIGNISDIEQAKILFRLANSQYKKALEYYDNESLEHIEIKQDMSRLYKYLVVMEED